jgi:hypothetical protein
VHEIILTNINYSTSTKCSDETKQWEQWSSSWIQSQMVLCNSMGWQGQQLYFWTTQMREKNLLFEWLKLKPCWVHLWCRVFISYYHTTPHIRIATCHGLKMTWQCVFSSAWAEQTLKSLISLWDYVMCGHPREETQLQRSASLEAQQILWRWRWRS